MDLNNMNLSNDIHRIETLNYMKIKNHVLDYDLQDVGTTATLF